MACAFLDRLINLSEREEKQNTDHYTIDVRKQDTDHYFIEVQDTLSNQKKLKKYEDVCHKFAKSWKSVTKAENLWESVL